MTRPGAIAILLATFLAACGQDEAQVAQPREPGPGAVGHYCRMTLAEHKGPKGQILPRGWQEPVWFSSVQDALTYVAQDIVSERELAGFWVNDMGQGSWDQPAPGSWIDARTAWFVIGSTKTSGMGGGEAVPFKDKATAEGFTRDHGGRVVTYAVALENIANSAADSETESGT